MSFGGNATGAPAFMELEELMFAKNVTAELRLAIERYATLKYAPVFG
jgi:hypothetical protein